MFDKSEYDIVAALVMDYEQTASFGEMIVIEDGDLGLDNIAHEIGHSMGCNHATYWKGEGGYVGPSVENLKAGGWQTGEYGAVFEPMGAANNRHFSAINKSILGYLEPAHVKTILTLGTYELFALEAPATGPVEFRLPFKDVGDKIFYTLEYRMPIGAFDSEPLMSGEGQSTGFVVVNGEPLLGVIIRLRWDRVSANLPASSGAPLVMPQTMITKEVDFVDSYRNITIKVLDYVETNKVILSIEGDWY